MTFRRTVAAALAATAIAAPAATAQPADIHAPLATAHQQRQDLRSPDAIDAARAQRKDLRSPDALDAALRRGRSAIAVVSSPGHPSEAAHTTPLPPQTTEALADSGGGIDWATVALGSAALMLFLGGVVALMTRTRPTSGPRVSV
jgi:hypothetical protein